MNPFAEIFGGNRYSSTMACLTNDTVIAALFVVSDVILAVALMAVGYRLWINRETGCYLLPYQCRMAVIIAALMSVGYVVDVVTIFDGIYRVEVLLRGTVAGLASVFAFSFYVSARE